MNKEARPITQEQRKEFVQLLKDAKTRVLDTLANRHSKRYAKAWHSAVAELMETLGAKKLFEKAVTSRKELKDTEKNLKNLGCYFDGDGELELTPEGSDRHGHDLRERQSQIMDDEVEAARKKYETATLNVLATESVEEAKAIVEPLV